MTTQLINLAIIDNLSTKIQFINLNNNVIEVPPLLRISVVVNYIAFNNNLNVMSDNKTVFPIGTDSIGQIINNESEMESYTIYITIPVDAIVNPLPLDISSNFPWLITGATIVTPIVTILGIKLVLPRLTMVVNKHKLNNLRKKTGEAVEAEKKASNDLDLLEQSNEAVSMGDLAACKKIAIDAKFKLKKAENDESNMGVDLKTVLDDTADTFHIEGLKTESYGNIKAGIEARRIAANTRKNASKDRKTVYADEDRLSNYLGDVDTSGVNRIVNNQGNIVDNLGNIIDNNSIVKSAKEVYSIPNGKFISESGQYLNNKGFTVDDAGNLIDKDHNLVNLKGEYLNESGQLIDKWARPIDIKGRLIDADNNLMDIRGVGSLKSELLDENLKSIAKEAYSKQLYSYTEKLGKLSDPEIKPSLGGNPKPPDSSSSEPSDGNTPKSVIEEAKEEIEEAKEGIEEPQQQFQRPIVEQPPPVGTDTQMEMDEYAAKQLQKRYEAEAKNKLPSEARLPRTSGSDQFDSSLFTGDSSFKTSPFDSSKTDPFSSSKYDTSSSEEIKDKISTLDEKIISPIQKINLPPSVQSDTPNTISSLSGNGSGSGSSGGTEGSSLDLENKIRRRYLSKDIKSLKDIPESSAENSPIKQEVEEKVETIFKYPKSNISKDKVIEDVSESFEKVKQAEVSSAENINSVLDEFTNVLNDMDVQESENSKFIDNMSDEMDTILGVEKGSRVESSLISIAEKRESLLSNISSKLKKSISEQNQDISGSIEMEKQIIADDSQLSKQVRADAKTPTDDSGNTVKIPDKDSSLPVSKEPIIIGGSAGQATSSKPTRETVDKDTKKDSKDAGASSKTPESVPSDPLDEDKLFEDLDKDII